MNGCSIADISDANASFGNNVIQTFLNNDTLNYSVNMYISQSSSKADLEKDTMQSNLSFQYSGDQSKGTITQTETLQKTENSSQESGVNNSTLYTVQYDQYRQYNNTCISIYSKNSLDAEWEHDEVGYDVELDFNSIKQILAQDIEFTNYLEKDDEYQLSMNFTHFFDLFFADNNEYLKEYTNHKEEIDALLKQSDVKFIFEKDKCWLKSIKMDEVHWYDQDDVKNKNYSYSFHIDISDYGNISGADVTFPSDLNR